MVILFRPYLLDQKTEKSYNSSDPNVTSINPDIALVCQWIGCNRAFENLDMLSNHVAKEHANPRKDGMFYCGWKDCNRGDKGFNARYKMLVHVRTHTNEKPHHCYQCNKSFSRAENLKIHSRSHTGEKPYVCTVPGCGKAYSNSSDRFKHSRTHAVDKPYACKVPGCPKRYTDPSSLRKHVKTYKHYPATVSNELKEEQIDKKSCIVNERLTPMKEEVPMNEFKLGFNKILCDETKVKLSVMSYLPAYHFNEIYLWHQSNGLQVYNSPLSIGSNFDKCVNMDEPLDLRINCD